MREALLRTLLCAAAPLALASQARAQDATIPAAQPATAETASDDQQVDAATEANQADAPGTAEIVVTALKRSTTLQRVPAAVSVVDSERLVGLGVTNLSQLGNLAPGISVVPLRTQAIIFVRGVGQTLTSPNADAAVATNLNGIYLPSEIAGTAFFDVDRIEVLPGPQGTLYGRNSTGGVINISSRMPKPEFGADGFVEIGNYDRRQVVVGVDIPLGPNLLSRTAGTIVRHDGYFNNGLDDQRTAAIRQTLVWTPGSGTTVTGVATYSHDGGLGNILQNIPPLECGNRCARFDPRALGYSNDVDVFTASLQVAHELSDQLTVTYLGGYNELDLRLINSIFTGPPLAPLQIDTEIDTQSHELRLNGDFGDLTGILGAYYFDQNTFFQNDARVTPSVRRINPFNADSHGTAIFGEGTFSVTPSLRLTGGLRYSNTVKSIDGFNQLFNAAGVRVFIRPYEGRSTLNRVDWKVALEYDLGPRSMVYANVSTGFTPGGFSTAPAVLGQIAAAPFEPVTLRAYVAGIKNRFAQGRITANLEAFYYDYKNYQLSVRDLNTGENIVFNADKATIYGAQVDTNFRPSPNDDISISATYLHAKADRLVTTAGRFDGFDLPFSPRWTVNAYYQRTFDLANDAEIRANVNFKYTSSRWAIYTHAPGFDIEANTNTSVNLGYYAPGDRWYLQGFVRNLEDSLVKTQCANAAPGPAGCNFEPPRTYGLTAGFKI